ncbi:MAG: TIGR04282 family arsenosugar biosynthesis glycosyltransferase [Alphaproteobacteria bacterium]
MKAKRHLVVLAKAPRLGAVKTRLGRDIGVVAACQFYRRTLERVLGRLARDKRWACHIAVTPDGTVQGHRFWPEQFQPVKQGGGDLGARMARPFQTLPPGPVVLIGGDVPDIQARHIEAAFRALGEHDAVFGPARDGGYWLVGARRRPMLPDLFSGVRWSSPRTLAETLKKLNKNKVALLETLDDIDDGQAYGRWLKKPRP